MLPLGDRLHTARSHTTWEVSKGGSSVTLGGHTTALPLLALSPPLPDTAAASCACRNSRRQRGPHLQRPDVRNAAQAGSAAPIKSTAAKRCLPPMRRAQHSSLQTLARMGVPGVQCEGGGQDVSSVGPSSVQDLSGTFPTTQPHATWLSTDPTGGYAQPAPMSPGRHLAGQQMGSARLPPTRSQALCF